MKKKLLMCALLLVPVTMRAQDDVETRAMRDEMKRSMQDLHLEGMDPPYFISYKIIDIEKKDAQASLGSLTSSSESRSRSLMVSVRVGSYDSDNSGFTSMNMNLGGLLGELLAGSTVLPLDDNYEELRRRIWLATDVAYKKAIEDMAGKRSALQNRNRPEVIADFSKEPARQETDTIPRVEVRLADAEHLVRSASAIFLKLHGVETSEADFEAVNVTEHFLNSEGTFFLRQEPEVYFHATASLQYQTGQAMTDSVSEYGRSMEDLPIEAALTHEVSQLVQHLDALDNARSAEPYNGPVLFEGMAAAELFEHDFANLLSAMPPSITNSSSALTSLLREPSGSLLNKLGTRVLPDFLTVVDNPQLKQANGPKLLGGYKFDEEGTPAQETVLVKDGILKTLLTSRAPVRGIAHSSGNMRERGVLPGNILVKATKTSSLEQMKQQMLGIVKARGLEYGIIVRRLSNGNNAIEAYRLFPDGHEEMVSFAHVTEITYNSFKNILAASDQPAIYTVRASGTLLLPGGPFAPRDLVTYVVPGLLFEDVSLVHASNNSAKPTVIPSPI
jgi:predicted Zn-dependent protease